VGRAGTQFGVYAASYAAPEGKPRAFRVLLHAELPDRIHAEVLGPIGGPRLIVDGGGGRLAVTFVGEGTSYVGEATAEALDAVLGVRIALDELVSGLLTGEIPPGAPYRLLRSPAGDGGLPGTVEVISPSGGRLELRLKKRRAVATVEPGLASGTPPPRTRHRPLIELAGRDGTALIAPEPAG